MTNLRASLSRIRDVLLIALFSLVPLLWFSGNQLLMSGDITIQPMPAPKFLASLYSWDPGVDGGSASLQLPRKYDTLFFGIFNSLGFSIPTIDRFYVISLYFVAGVSMYYLTSVLMSSSVHKRSAALTSALIFMYNPLRISDGLQSILEPMAFCVIPAVLAFCIKGLTEKKI